MDNAETIRGVFNTFTEEQKNALYYIVGLIMECKADGVVLLSALAALNKLNDNQKTVAYSIIESSMGLLK